MEETAYRAIAIVGAGAVLPDAVERRSLLGKREEGPLQHHRCHTRSVGPRVLLRCRIPTAPDKTYSKIGGWVREFSWDPMKWHMPICRRGSPMPWIKRRSGPSRLRAKLWMITAIPSDR